MATPGAYSNIGDETAIDVHAHYGSYKRSSQSKLANQFMSASAAIVADRAAKARVALTVVSPLSGLMPRGEADAVAGNDEAARVIAETDGLLQWAIIDPHRPDTFRQAERMLKQPVCVGIKIHPEEHCYPIREHGREIFEFAESQSAVVLAHSGEENSLPEDYVPFADDHPNMRLILAHIGCGWDGDRTHQVRAIQQSKRGNVFADTSSAMSLLPNLIEWAVGEVGADRVLFGTDTPLYSAAMQRARIDAADLSDEQKRMILRENAIQLLRLDWENKSNDIQK